MILPFRFVQSYSASTRIVTNYTTYIIGCGWFIHLKVNKYLNTSAKAYRCARERSPPTLGALVFLKRCCQSYSFRINLAKINTITINMYAYTNDKNHVDIFQIETHSSSGIYRRSRLIFFVICLYLQLPSTRLRRNKYD